VYLHLFSTYDVAYAQFHQDPLGSLKMALLQRRNMEEQHWYSKSMVYFENAIRWSFFHRNFKMHGPSCEIILHCSNWTYSTTSNQYLQSARSNTIQFPSHRLQSTILNQALANHTLQRSNTAVLYPTSDTGLTLWRLTATIVAVPHR
jgi:hypothetical protein